MDSSLPSASVKREKEKKAQKPYSAVIFDMDGLLLNTEVLSMAAWETLFNQLGYSYHRSLFLQMIGKDWPTCKKLLAQQFDASFPCDTIDIHFYRHYEKQIKEKGIQLKKGARETVSFLKEASIPFCIASSTVTARAFQKIKSCQLDTLFPLPLIIGGDQVTHGKPNPDIYLKAAQTIRIPPQNCIVLEDSEAGITAAHRAQMLPIMIPDLIPPNQELQKITHAICEDLFQTQPILKSLLSKRTSQNLRQLMQIL